MWFSNRELLGLEFANQIVKEVADPMKVGELGFAIAYHNMWKTFRITAGIANLFSKK